jgi:hypothetical protein
MVELLRKLRIESAIVIAGLLVLMFYSKPPRSGTANVNPAESMVPPLDESVEGLSLESLPEPVEVQPVTTKPPATEQPANDASQRPSKRLARVDATNCPALGYTGVVYGEVTVQWTWTGHELAPTKVVVVDEGNGISSVWNFNDQNGVIITELPPGTPPMP